MSLFLGALPRCHEEEPVKRIMVEKAARHTPVKDRANGEDAISSDNELKASEAEGQHAASIREGKDISVGKERVPAGSEP
jgi:hypothetical protein